MNAEGVLIGSLAVAFAFEINASQLGAESGSPSTGRASCSRGTCTITMQASPSTEETYAPRTSPGVCASPVDSTSGTSRSFLVNTVVFFPLALRQRTRRNAIQFSRYCWDYSRLTVWCQDGTILVWRRNRKRVQCASTNKISRPLELLGGTLASHRTMKRSGLRCGERCEKSSSTLPNPSPKSGRGMHPRRRSDGAFCPDYCK